jgi:hypothetical protein
MRTTTITFIFLFVACQVFSRANPKVKEEHVYLLIKADTTKDIFDSLLLGKLGMGRIAFDYAMLGYNRLKAKGLLSDNGIISIIDFSLPSNNKRMFVLDLKNYKLLFSTYVAHGRNSGTAEALYFSNEANSFKSSVGFYVTGETYNGQHGYSLKLDGYEKGYNDKAEERAIVIHSADYVSDVLIKQQGFIGRSLGCPALSPAINKSVIRKIKNRTCLFVFGNDTKYIQNSKMLKQPVRLQKKYPVE